MESWESLVVLFKFLGLLKKGRLKPSSSLLKLTFLDFSIHHFKNGGFEILNWPSWGSVDVWCLTGPAEEGLMGAEGINSRKNDLEHINQIVCFKKSTQKNLTLKQSEKVLNFRDTQTEQRHFIIIRGGYRQKIPCFTPNSFVMNNCKTFHLKHHLGFVKICPPTGQITFWPTLLKHKSSKLFYHMLVGCLLELGTFALASTRDYL